jgi:hypothetical protein
MAEMSFRTSSVGALAAFLPLFLASTFASAETDAGPVPIDLQSFDGAGGAMVEVQGTRLRLVWPAGPESAELVLNLDPAKHNPLFDRLALAGKTILERVEPVTLLTIGERDLKAPSGWVAFFDNPPLRRHQTVSALLKKARASVKSVGSRTVVTIGDVTADSFSGRLEITLVHGTPLIFVETVVSTREDGRAIVYDAGLVASDPTAERTPWNDPKSNTYSPLVAGPPWQTMAWLDSDGRMQRARAEHNRVAAPVSVARRTLVAETQHGAVAVFPPPHQYFYPLDFANNLAFAWYGAARNALMNGYAFGIRQPLEGDRIWVPWINAPPDTEQRLGVFYLLAASAGHALEEAGRFTRGDRYKALPGHKTFTSHYHIEHTLEVTKARVDQKREGVPRGLERPGFVKTFKARGVDIVHLAELHVGAIPRLPASERLPLLKTMHDECARLSDAELLVLPGEEPNVHLGGHWISLFPKPVYWVLNRPDGQPFIDERDGYGKVYHAGSPDDVLELMHRENGLMWTAHPRIKGSREYPDKYWNATFFRSDRFLGAAWKAMPADLSRDRLGLRVLDLLDDMANAGLRKYVLAEADLFRMEPDFESYAHMNVNYLQLDRLPKYEDGWQPVLDALREGRFFATTGEVLIPSFRIGGKRSGELLPDGGEYVLEADLEWTFPLAFAEVVSGDGEQVYRQRIDLSHTQPFGAMRLQERVRLPGRKWARLEVWDLARNGAFTQPVWISRGR